LLSSQVYWSVSDEWTKWSGSKLASTASESPCIARMRITQPKTCGCF
jgi:hypothetical protein